MGVSDELFCKRRVGMSIGGPVSSFATTFPATENPISQGGIWDNGATQGGNWHDAQTTGGVFAATHGQAVAADDDCIAVLKKTFIDFTPNQFVQGTAFRTPGYTQQHEILLLLRFAITSGSARGYEIYWTTAGGGALQLVRWNGALHDFTLLAPGVGFGTTLPTTDDTLKASIVGSIITVSFNGGASVLTYDDAGAGLIASGNPGLGNNPAVAPATFTDMAWKAMSAGNL